MFAHSVPGSPDHAWERMEEHVDAVATLAAGFAERFGWRELARMAGILHDIGKWSEAFQTYLRTSTPGGTGPRGPDHSSAGAQVAHGQYPHPVGRILAAIIAGHHSGLADADELDGRLTKAVEPYGGWKEATGSLPPVAALAPARRGASNPASGFSEHFLVRMLFSCLVDADFLATEAFYAKAERRHVEREVGLDLATLRQRLAAHMARKRVESEPSPLNALRASILDHAIGKASLPPGLFTLTVPTGGGKTLASLSFALEHAVAHGLRRVIYVIPFTSIIEQNAAVFREALGEDAGVLEHHASFDWEAAFKAAREDGRGTDPLDRLRRASENWDAPVVVTTAVQFFESLFANRTSRCRKLHNLAGAVIVLDEAQTLPLRVLRPCLAALHELAANYGATIVLCTATQPAWRLIDGALVDKRRQPFGLDIPTARELAPNPRGLFAELKRVAVERLHGPISDDVVAARFAEEPQMLCIVNSRRHAQALFERIRALPGAVHLSTLMVPRHRRLVLAEARRRLAAGEPVRIVSTSLIEAGVDIDLPEVWRAAAGIDSVAQSAGRCNREGRLERDGSRVLGRVVVFEPADMTPPKDLQAFWQAAEPVLRHYPDPLTLEAVKAYFTELYFQKGPDAVDGTILDERPGLLPVLSERAKTLAFPFRSIADAFRLIEDVMEPVIVPWRSGPDDHEAEDILRRIGAKDHPLAGDLRRLQSYTVSIPRTVRDGWLAMGVLRPVHPALGDALLRFDDDSLYDPATGLRVEEPAHRSADANVMGP